MSEFNDGKATFFNKQAELPETLNDHDLDIRLKELAKKIVPFNIIIPLVVIAAIGLALFFIIRVDNVVPVIFIWIAGFVVIAILSTMKTALVNKIKLLVSHNLIRGVLAGEFELGEYEPEKHIDAGRIFAASLLDTWNHESGSDFVYGKYKGVNFSFSDISLTYRSSGKGRHHRSIFRGQWIICELAQELPFTMQIRKNTLIKGPGKKPDMVTGNDAFDSKYIIKTSGPQAALSVLTPRLIDFVLDKEKNSGIRTYLSFTGSQVHIAFSNSRDLFEVKTKEIMRGNGAGDIREQMREDARHITGAIDELLANKMLFG